MVDAALRHEKSSLGLKRKLLQTILKVSLSASLIYWILQGTDLYAIWDAARQADITLLVIAFSLHFLGFIISAIRWRLLLRSRGSDASIRFLVESYIVGVFFNNLLPSTIGGDAYRAYDTWRLGQNKSSALSIVFVDRFLGLLVLMLFAVATLLISKELAENLPFLPLWVVMMALGMIIFVWFIFSPPVWLPQLFAGATFPLASKLNILCQALFAFQGQKIILVKALGLSTVLQANVVIHYYLIALALNIPIKLTSFFLIVPLATIITMLPISVNGIGIRENAYIYFFGILQVMKPLTLAFVWIGFGMVIVQGIIGGFFYALRR